MEEIRRFDPYLCNLENLLHRNIAFNSLNSSLDGLFTAAGTGIEKKFRD